MKAIGIVLCLLAFAFVSAEENDAAPANLDELQVAIADLIAEREVPAVAIAMLNEAGPVWIGAIGKANLENDTAADENTLFRIGSTSKMFVALSVLKLVEEGKLSLQDKLSELAPDVAYENQWEDTDPIRVVHLLEHTTGWDDIHLPEYAHNDPTPISLKEGLEYHPHSRVSRWKPGSRMSYCNAGPPVAAYIVEKLTGQDFEDYVRENFFAPLGMQSTTYRLTDEVKAKGATLYANGNEPQDYWHIIMRPSGSINSSATDMAKFVAFYLNRGAVNGEQLISQQSLARMETPGSTNAAKIGQQTGYGLHNYSSTHEHWTYRAHNGGVNGGITEFAYLPEARLGHVIMINSDDGQTFGDISDLVRGYETGQLTPEEAAGPIEVTAAHRTIEGLYYPINPRQQISHFMERIFGARRLWFEADRLQHKALLGGDTTSYLPVSSELYQAEKTGLISLSQAVDPLAGDVVHINNAALKPVWPPILYAQLAIAIIWAVCVVSSVAFFLVWIVRKLRGKIPSGATIRIRLWPLLASMSIVVFLSLLTLGMSDPFALLGKPTAVSVGLTLSTLAFALFAALGLYTAVKERSADMNRVNYWYSTLSSVVHVLVAVYLFSFGVIGSVTWA